MRISDWSSDVCSSDLCRNRPASECRLPMPGPGISDDLRDVGARRLPAQQFTRLAAARDQHRRIAGATRSARNIELAPHDRFGRSEEHTSELQSIMRTSYAVFFLKKTNNKT